MDYEKTLSSLTAFNFIFHLNTCIDIDEEYQKHLVPSITLSLYRTEKFNVITETELTDPFFPDHEVYFRRRMDSLCFFQKLGVITSYTDDATYDDIPPFSDLVINKENLEAIKESFKKIYHDKYIKKYPVNYKLGTFLDSYNEESNSLNANNKILYSITFPISNEITLNDLIVLSKPNLDSENAKVFAFLFQHPNKKFSKKQIEEHLGHSIGKSLHKIVENLGFKNDVRKLFFSVSANAILFRNPIESYHLKELNVKPLRLNIMYKNQNPTT